MLWCSFIVQGSSPLGFNKFGNLSCPSVLSILLVLYAVSERAFEGILLEKFHSLRLCESTVGLLQCTTIVSATHSSRLHVSLMVKISTVSVSSVHI